ncbi:hypothetical protein BDF20DRAFT_800009, partial [Mycotypha africana]|uniref:uncharacterized protein n=1 Tax=Mycotypha africana TaxID=64632 RepID=UPI002301D809
NDDIAEQGFEKREDYLIIHGYQMAKDKPYDAEGKLSKGKMLRALPSEQLLSSVVGYFKFRRQTETELS